MRLRKMKQQIDQGQTAALYSDEFDARYHVYSRQGGYVWVRIFADSADPYAPASWLSILAHMPMVASRKWEIL